MMRRSRFPLVVIVLTVIAGCAAKAQVQSGSNPKQLVAVHEKLNRAVPLRQRRQTVVLKMAGDPVAVVRSRLPNKHISEVERDGIVRDLRTQQDTITPTIEAVGGKVLAKFQHAINGIKVQATPDQITLLSKLSGVIAVKPVLTYHLDNAHSVPFIGAPTVWQGPPGLRGEHIKVAVIDTGIDYTHANFGGPGTIAAFQTAFANSTQPADPTLFGPNAPKVKGGTDLVGDAYFASSPDPARNTPHPDPNPLDCNGHGSHTSGTTAGFGVTSDGHTFHGPYDATTPSQSFAIGPGVAPLADLYAVRVFGCQGDTNVVVEAIDWAIANDMQVINMSLGAPFGSEDSADAEASENAVEAGIVVVAAAANAGPIPYITASPASGDKVISVAAIDSHDFFPGATMALSPSGSIVAQDSNGVAFSNGTNYNVVVLPTDATHPGIGGVSLGCDPAEYTAAGVAGKLVVTARGVCARVARAIFGQQAGAVAVAMINNATGYPPFEGPITGNPDNGQPFNVTIPFFGVQGAASGLSADGAALKAASSASATNTTIANPTFRHLASFTSGGPREGDGNLKPDLSAPGVSIFSTAIGTGNGGLFLSGTSMATPHVAGTAALAVQAHPDWDAETVATAIVNTGDATQLRGYSARLGGNGLVQPIGATRTSIIARAENGAPNLSFGVEEFTSDFNGSGNIHVKNLGHGSASFSISIVKGPGAAHSVSVSPTSITLSGHASRTLHVNLTVPAATVGDSSAFRQVQGRIVLTPSGGNDGAALSVPYYLVARARSNVQAHLRGDLGEHASANVQLNNRSNVVAGTADFYAWGLSGQHANLGSIGIRAVGVQSFTDPQLGQILVFAVNTFASASNPVAQLYDIFVLDSTGAQLYEIEAADLGLLNGSGSFTGKMVTAVFNLKTNSGVLEFLATAPTDGSTVLMPIVAADAGITGSNPRFTYVAQTTSLISGNTDKTTTAASFNAFNNAISTGAFAVLAPGASATVPISIDRAEFALTPALGEMVVALENQNGHEEGNTQALLLSAGGD
jgi:subtilisin family serine protease